MPSLLVLTTRCVLVAGLVTVMVAPATIAPVESLTAPVISPLGPCAHPPIENKTSSVAAHLVKPGIELLADTKPPEGVPSKGYNTCTRVVKVLTGQFLRFRQWGEAEAMRPGKRDDESAEVVGVGLTWKG